MNVTTMLVYEPASAQSPPIPLCRISDPELALIVAKTAICHAESRAAELSNFDRTLADTERAEARRLRAALTKLLPSLSRKKR
jgi:hypothetical protein